MSADRCVTHHHAARLAKAEAERDAEKQARMRAEDMQGQHRLCAARAKQRAEAAEAERDEWKKRHAHLIDRSAELLAKERQRTRDAKAERDELRERVKKSDAIVNNRYRFISPLEFDRITAERDSLRERCNVLQCQLDAASTPLRLAAELERELGTADVAQAVAEVRHLREVETATQTFLAALSATYPHSEEYLRKVLLEGSNRC